MRDCTCVGSCKGAAGLGPNWNCVVDNGPMETVYPTAIHAADTMEIRDSGDAAHIENLETERDDLLRRLHLLINAAYDVIEKAEDENWLCYNGTDESRLQGLEDALEAVGEPESVDAVDPCEGMTRD